MKFELNTSKMKFFIDEKRDKNYIILQFPVFEKLMGRRQIINLIKKYYPQFSYNPEKDISSCFYIFWNENKNFILENLKKRSREIVEKWKVVKPNFFQRNGKDNRRVEKKKYFCRLSSTYICGGGYDYPALYYFNSPNM